MPLESPISPTKPWYCHLRTLILQSVYSSRMTNFERNEDKENAAAEVSTYRNSPFFRNTFLPILRLRYLALIHGLLIVYTYNTYLPIYI